MLCSPLHFQKICFILKMFYSSSHGFFRSLILCRIFLARLAQSFFFFSFFSLSLLSSCACGREITSPSFFSLFFEHQQTLSEEHFYEKNTNLDITFHFALRLLESQCSSIIIIFIPDTSVFTCSQ